MQYDDFSIDERPTWGVRSPRDGGDDLGLVRETLKKEQVIKSVLLNLSNFFALDFNSQPQRNLSFTRRSEGYVCITLYIPLIMVERVWFQNSYVGQGAISAKGNR